MNQPPSVLLYLYHCVCETNSSFLADRYDVMVRWWFLTVMQRRSPFFINPVMYIKPTSGISLWILPTQGLFYLCERSRDSLTCVVLMLQLSCCSNSSLRSDVHSHRALTSILAPCRSMWLWGGGEFFPRKCYIFFLKSLYHFQVYEFVYQWWEEHNSPSLKLTLLANQK